MFFFKVWHLGLSAAVDRLTRPPNNFRRELQTARREERKRISPYLPLRRKGIKKKMVSELGDFAPLRLNSGQAWREEFPSPRNFLRRTISRKACLERQRWAPRPPSLQFFSPFALFGRTVRCRYRGAKSYLMTFSARLIVSGGMITPICSAVFKLTQRSNLVGCTSVRSPGLAPLRILSTYSAARRDRSGRFTP